jgi:multidrug resistance efflux pump|tara:strand:+ start:3085 stop:3414 length:330 start_codon:yes stop_codon:yes gene_type:complete
VQFEKYENLERQQKELIKSYEVENLKLQEQNEQLNQALSQGELGIREQVEHWKSQYYEMERQHADLQSELEKEKALWEGKFEFLEKQKEQAKKDNEDALRQFQQTVDQL